VFFVIKITCERDYFLFKCTLFLVQISSFANYYVVFPGASRHYQALSIASVEKCSQIDYSSSAHTSYLQLECGPMPNVMAALSNIGGALCSTPQSLADAHY